MVGKLGRTLISCYTNHPLIFFATQVRTPVPWLSEVLAVMEEIVEVCQEISDKVSGSHPSL